METKFLVAPESPTRSPDRMPQEITQTSTQFPTVFGYAEWLNMNCLTVDEKRVSKSVESPHS